MKTDRGRVSSPPIPPPPSAISEGGCYISKSSKRKNILENILDIAEMLIHKKNNLRNKLKASL